MGMTLQEVVEELKKSKKKTQLIYAFNGTGKTRLSREFEKIVNEIEDEEHNVRSDDFTGKKAICYNAFTEDLFKWINIEEPYLEVDESKILDWVFFDSGKENEAAKHFKRYTSNKINPVFVKGSKAVGKKDSAYFTIGTGNDDGMKKVKISKGEESCYMWSVFYHLLESAIEELNKSEETDRSTAVFDNLEYIFIDDPVSSLDDNNLIELAVDLAQLVKSSKSKMKFIITTHNPLFFNVLANEFGKSNTYKFQRDEYDEYRLDELNSDSPFAYHLNIHTEILDALEKNDLKKYHYIYLRNLIEKTSTFLGYSNWAELLPQTDDGRPNPYEIRLINILSHSKYSTEEMVDISENDKRVFKYIFENFENNLKFKEEKTNV